MDNVYAKKMFHTFNILVHYISFYMLTKGPSQKLKIIYYKMAKQVVIETLTFIIYIMTMIFFAYDLF